MIKKTIKIQGMTCPNCVKHVKEALSELNGTINVEVSLETGTAILESDKEILDSDIKDILDEFGYSVVSIA